MRDFLFFLCLIFFSFLSFLSRPRLKLENGQKVRINLKVFQEPDKFFNSQRVRFYDRFVILPRYPEVNIGDKIIVEGKVKEKYIEVENFQVTSKGGGLFFLREKMISFLKIALPYKHWGLLAGILLGSKEGIPNDLWEKLIKTGTFHIVVASGTNVAIVGGFFQSLFLLFFKRKMACLISIISVWLYSFLVGFEAPIIRACLMFSLSFGAVIFGRLKESIRILFMTFFLMLIFNPYWVYDFGFILSFTSTLSIIFLERKINSFLRVLPAFLREGISTTISSQIGSLPVIFISFGRFFPLTFLTNALVLFTIPYITIFGMISLLLSLFLPFLARILVLSVYPLTFYFLFVISLF